MAEVDHKKFPLWGQFIDRKSEWIGGRLIDTDTDFGMQEAETKIKDIRLELWPEKLTEQQKAVGCVQAIVFIVAGEDFDCSFNVKYGGVQPDRNAAKEGYIALGTAYGSFKIYQNKKEQSP